MNRTETSLFDVAHVHVQPVDGSKGYRWQRIIVTTIDGAEHCLVMHLADTYAGLDCTPRSRVDDVPRQPALIPE